MVKIYGKTYKAVGDLILTSDKESFIVKSPIDFIVDKKDAELAVLTLRYINYSHIFDYNKYRLFAYLLSNENKINIINFHNGISPNENADKGTSLGYTLSYFIEEPSESNDILYEQYESNDSIDDLLETAC